MSENSEKVKRGEPGFPTGLANLLRVPVQPKSASRAKRIEQGRRKDA